VGNEALVSRKVFKLEHGEKVELSEDDLRRGDFSSVLIEEVWDTKHPDCPFEYLRNPVAEK